MSKPKYSKKELEVKRLIHNINERLRKAERQFGGTFITEIMGDEVLRFTNVPGAEVNKDTGRIRETEQTIRAIANSRYNTRDKLQKIAERIDVQRIIEDQIAQQSGEAEAAAQSVAIGNALRKRGHKEINEIVKDIQIKYTFHTRMNDIIDAMYDNIPSDEVAVVMDEFPNHDIGKEIKEYESKHGEIDKGDFKSLHDFFNWLKHGDPTENAQSPLETQKAENKSKMITGADLLKQMLEKKGQ